jgi:STAS-like domain of unknown function (DUF4325)
MVIRVLDIVPSADTGDQGAAVFARLRQELGANAKVTLSFEGVKTATSSFVNLAFVQLLSSFSLPDIKSRLRIVASTRQINDMIRTRMEREGAAQSRPESNPLHA